MKQWPEELPIPRSALAVNQCQHVTFNSCLLTFTEPLPWCNCRPHLGKFQYVYVCLGLSDIFATVISQLKQPLEKDKQSMCVDSIHSLFAVQVLVLRLFILCLVTQNALAFTPLAVFNDGIKKDLFCLDGTIPVNYKGQITAADTLKLC